MYKKTIKYTDYNGVEHEDDFYFNLTKFEVIRMDAEQPGGFENYVKRIYKASDSKTLMAAFEKIVLDSYGEKDAVGLHFVKSPELSEAFRQTEAYSELMMELITNEQSAVEFVNGILPVVVESDKLGVVGE